MYFSEFQTHCGAFLQILKTFAFSEIFFNEHPGTFISYIVMEQFASSGTFLHILEHVCVFWKYFGILWDIFGYSGTFLHILGHF